MANKAGHRRFGNVRKLPSGRSQARYKGPDGITRNAPRTFETDTAAARWLTLVEAEIIRGDWQPPEAGEVNLGAYASQWISERKVAPTTKGLYGVLFRKHLDPYLGHLALDQVKPATIRAWRASLLKAGVSATTAAKAYRLLRAIFTTAVKEDEALKKNPCRILGYDREPTPERPVASVAQVYRLAELVPSRFQALILFAAFTGLRWGELVALRGYDIGYIDPPSGQVIFDGRWPGRLDLDAVELPTLVVRVSRKLAELNDGSLLPGAPKSVSGVRMVTLPDPLSEAMKQHREHMEAADPESLLFTGGNGKPLRRSNFRRAVDWDKTIIRAGLPAGFHFHDLRHTGNTLAASTGASTRELMHRMGHASVRAALIYQHATQDRDREIASALSDRITKAVVAHRTEDQQRGRRLSQPNGTPMARRISKRRI